MTLIVIGIALILIGILYQVKPNIYRRWFWTRTSIAQRLLGPEAYEKYIRILGMILIVIGIGAILFAVIYPQK